VHRRAVADDQDVALAPDVVIDDLRPDHPVEQIAHVGLARLGRHAVALPGAPGERRPLAASRLRFDLSRAL
jgi:hypothetical protein